MKCKALRCIYYNEGNGYTVASYVTEEALPEKVSTQKNSQYGMFTAVGNELPTEEGLEVELNGTWKDGKFGMQYKVSSFQVVLPTNTEGIKAYLASDFIKGIGPVLAERIVDHYRLFVPAIPKPAPKQHSAARISRELIAIELD